MISSLTRTHAGPIVVDERTGERLDDSKRFVFAAGDGAGQGFRDRYAHDVKPQPRSELVVGTMDELINASVVAQLRSSLAELATASALEALSAAETALPGKRLRDRVDIVRDALLEDLPESFADTEKIALGLLQDPTFAGWVIWPASEWVVRRALETQSGFDFDSAMEMLARFTVRLSGEFAVRDLLIARPERGLEIMKTWVQHPNEHVRRLASEGSRAYLPWARRVPWLIDHPDATLDILDGLYRDSAEYVRRSVANHLNDLSRVDPAVVAGAAARWGCEPDTNTAWVQRHGLRTLIKQGHPSALEIVGFTGDDLLVRQPTLTAETVARGGTLTFTSTITNNGESEANVAIDYSIGFQRANGSVRPKTFKIASRRIAAGESVSVTKSHSFRQITTRTYYPGPHFVTVQANGLVSQPTDFQLVESVDDPARAR